MDTLYPEIIKVLQEIHNRYPDLRFGEVLQTAADRVRQGKNVSLHDVSSKEFFAALKAYQSSTEESRIMQVKQERKALQRIQLQKDKGMKP